MKLYKFERGFTLIEIMVVISIIAVLSSVLFVSFSDARSSARDAVRQADLKQLQLAIELYRAQNGRYPDPGCGSSGWNGPGPGNLYAACTEYIAGLVPDFISELPVDPHQDRAVDSGFLYYVSPARTSYKVLVWRTVEVDRPQNYNHPFARCPSPASPVTAWCGALSPQTNTYAVYSRGEEWR